MKSKNIIFNHTLAEYNKKYRFHNFKLLKLTKKDIDEFKKKHPFEDKDFLLKGHKWWYINGTYYQVPNRALRYSLIGGSSAIAAAGIAAGIIIPMLQGSTPTPVPPTPVETYYTVRFDTNGGEGTFASQKVKKGEYAKKPENDPTKTGYYFSRWLDNGTPYNFDVPVTQDITVTADYTTQMFTISFYESSSAAEPYVTKTVPYYSAVRTPDDPTTSEDKAFKGWYLADDTAYNFDNPVVDNLNLYAKWDNCYTVTWNITNTLTETEKVVQNSVLTQLSKSKYQSILEEYSDCELEGWFTYEEGREPEEYVQYDFNAPITGDLTLYAKWHVNSQDFLIVGDHNIDDTKAKSEKGVTLTLISNDDNNLGKELSTTNVTATSSKGIFTPEVTTDGVVLKTTEDTGSDEITITKTYKDPTSNNGDDVVISKTFEVELGSYSKLKTSSLEIGEAEAKDDSVEGAVYIPKRYYSETKEDWVDIHKIAQGAFEGNEKIEEVYISVPTIEIGKDAFKGCDGLESLEFEDESNSWGFDGTEYKPSQMQDIINKLKEGTSSDKVPLKTGLRFTAIKDSGGTTTVAYSVRGESTEFPNDHDLLIPSVVTVDENTGIATSTTTGLPVTEIDENGFASFTTLKTLTIHSKSYISNISAGAFGQCDNLTGVYFLENQVGTSINSIKDKAFAECSNLKNIEIPSTVEYIGKHAFAYSGLQSIVIPSSVKDIVTKEGTQPGIDEDAFNNCGSLNTVTINSNSISSIPEGTFASCSSLEQFTVPYCIKTIYGTSFEKAGLTSVSFADTTSIWMQKDDVIIEANGNTADAKAASASTLKGTGSGFDIIEKVDVYSDFEFEPVDKSELSKGYKLTLYKGSKVNVTIPSYYSDANGTYPVVEIVSTAFDKYRYEESGEKIIEPDVKITSVVIPNTVKTIGKSAFSELRLLQSVKLPVNSEFTEIPEYAFYNTHKLTSVYIPDSVIKIGKYAFRTDYKENYGKGLQEATFASEITKWNLDPGSSKVTTYTTNNNNISDNGQALRSGNLTPGYGESTWTRITGDVTLGVKSTVSKLEYTTGESFTTNNIILNKITGNGTIATNISAESYVRYYQYDGYDKGPHGGFKWTEITSEVKNGTYAFSTSTEKSIKYEVTIDGTIYTNFDSSQSSNNYNLIKLKWN